MYLIVKGVFVYISPEIFNFECIPLLIKRSFIVIKKFTQNETQPDGKSYDIRNMNYKVHQLQVNQTIENASVTQNYITR